MTESQVTIRGWKFKDLAGQPFGRLTVSHLVGKDGAGNVLWSCRCECGSEATVRTADLTSHNTRSCGCLKRAHLLGNVRRQTHGGRNTPEYEAWRRIKKCCFVPATKAYPHYGGRGITVCAGWRDSFEAFLADVGRKPQKNLSLDRKDNEGHYSCGHCAECTEKGWPANCHWATATQQHRNKRSNRVLTHGGVTCTLAEWSERTGISQNILHLRLRAGWSVPDALTRSVRKLPRRKHL